MATFLELCQAVARESGTFQRTAPLSTANQSGRELKVINWTRSAWLQIQNDRPDWHFLIREFQGSVPADTARIGPGALGIVDFAGWMPPAYPLHSWPASGGMALRLSPLNFIDWRTRFAIGEQRPGPPQFYALSTDNELCLGPVPDQAYTVSGFYRRRPQVLVNDDDVPIVPERFHDVIVWKALLMLDKHDEAVNHVRLQRAMVEYTQLYYAMVRELVDSPKLAF